MSHLSVRRLAIAVALGSLLIPGLAPTASAQSSPSWHGSRHVPPRAYHWATGERPSEGYAITVLRGLTTHQVLHRLGQVRTPLGRLTYQEATNYAFDRVGPDYSMPTVVQVARLGHAVVVYEPVSARGFFHSHRLTRGHARLASFITDVNLDTYVKVARNGANVRSFDPSFRPPRQGALPEEKGLRFGRSGGNVFERSWAFIERITLTHISRAWFERSHPTYVLRWRT